VLLQDANDLLFAEPCFLHFAFPFLAAFGRRETLAYVGPNRGEKVNKSHNVMWSEMLVSPGVFSRGLADYSQSEQNHHSDGRSTLRFRNPKTVVKTRESKSPIRRGDSTAQ
jgi:hypothetical protein